MAGDIQRFETSQLHVLSVFRYKLPRHLAEVSEPLAGSDFDLTQKG